MKKYDTIFLDRDGTINPDPGYIRSLDQFEFYPNTIPALNHLLCVGNQFCIITNQSGIGRGLIQEDDLKKIHDYIEEEFEKNNLPLIGIYHCPDHPEHATLMRKPGPGMFQKAANEHGINLENCLMVGDAVSDIEAGVNLGMETLLVLTGKGMKTVDSLKTIRPTFIAEDILDGANLITEHLSK